MSSFPQEIFDFFIDYLSHSPADLKSLSLVEKSWLPRTRKYLFRRFRISPLLFYSANEQDYADQSTAMVKSFEHILRAPDITHCIKGIIIDRKVQDAGVRFGGLCAQSSKPPEGVSPRTKERIKVIYVEGSQVELVPETTHPCSLVTTLMLNDIKFLSYHWEACTDDEAWLHEYPPLSHFSELLKNHGPGLKQLHLRDAHVAIPSDGHQPQVALSFFEPLAAYASSLETLCIHGISYMPNAYSKLQLNSPRNLDALRQALREPSKKYGSISSGRKIAFKQFLFRNPKSVTHGALEVLLFENIHLVYTGVIYLALDTSSIPLFVNRPHCFHNVKHLTLLDYELNTRKQQWTAHKANLCLSSLSSLQLVVHWYQRLITICRVIGECFDSLPDSASSPECTRHLHIEFGEGADLSMEESLSSIVDTTLHSYLVDGHLKNITVNRPEVLENWPLTWSTGRIRLGEGDSWWDTERW